MYTLYVGDEDGNVDSVDIKYVNTAAAEAALKNAKTVTDLQNIFAETSTHKEALMFLGFDIDLLASLQKTEKVCSNLFNSCNLLEAETSEILSVFNTYLGLETINKGVAGGVELVNPAFGNA